MFQHIQSSRRSSGHLLRTSSEYLQNIDRISSEYILVQEHFSDYKQRDIAPREISQSLSIEATRHMKLVIQPCESEYFTEFIYSLIALKPFSLTSLVFSLQYYVMHQFCISITSIVMRQWLEVTTLIFQSLFMYFSPQ